MLATIVGTAYSLLQLVVSICNVVSGGDGKLVLSFSGDKAHILSYLEIVLIKK